MDSKLQEIVASRAIGRQPSEMLPPSDGSCLLCGSKEKAYLFTMFEERFENCTNCGLVFGGPLQTGKVIPELYLDSADSKTEQQAADRYLSLLQQQGTSGNLLLIAPQNHPLEAAAKDYGFRVETYLNVPALTTTTLAPDHYDAAVILYAMELVQNPVNLLEQVRAALKPDGVVLIVALSLDSWSARFFGTRWIGWRPGRHYYYNNHTLNALLLKSGFGGVRLRPDVRRYTLHHIYERAKVAPRQTWLTRATRLAHFIAPGFTRQTVMTNISTSGIVCIARRVERHERPLLSVVMPVYNERATVEDTLKLVLEKQIAGIDKEVVIVESNSKDGTRDAVLKYENHPEVRLVLEDRAQGKGHAVRTGLAHARGDYVLIQDADREYDVNDYEALLEPLRSYRAAFVLGSRHTAGWKIREFSDQPRMSTYFNFGHVLFRSALNLLYRQRLKDPFTMYKVFWRDCLYGLEFECNRFDFDFELVIKLVRKGYNPLEIPVNYRARSFAEGKKVSMLRDPISWVRALIRFRFAKLYPRENL